ncbi:MAG: O-antigen ligase family protein [Candidatus Paceibacterota bacterium]|jgi:O-antigen ligase
MKISIKILLLSLGFLTPLIVDSSVFFPYITGKSMFIRGIVSLAWLVFFVGLAVFPNFRKEILTRLKKVWKNPVFISVLFFWGTILLSTIFSVNRFRAFLGDTERGEGFIGLTFFISFFIISLLVFEKKDWVNFFRLSIFTGLILFVGSLMELFRGVSRPASFTGNPIYLAAFFLFVICSALVVIWDSWQQRKKFWFYTSLAAIIFSIFGIFITQTRGVIIGLFAGVIMALLWLVFSAKEIKIFNKVSLKKLSIWTLVVMGLFSSIFYLTKDGSFWQKIPGFDRLSQLSLKDPTFQTRLISLGVSLKAINPVTNGFERLLIGWGPENFSFAYNKYYNPDYYQYENSWFDRAHNKLMDVLVMHGILGLLAYLVIWIGAFWSILKSKKFNIASFGLIFFGVSYFVQNLFVFDSVATYIPFFAFMSFTVFWKSQEDSEEISSPTNHSKKDNIVVLSIFGLTSLALLVLFYFYSLISYVQMRNYISLIKSGDGPTILENIDKVMSPYSFSQENIRTHFAALVINYFGQGGSSDGLIRKAVYYFEELWKKEPYSPRYALQLGEIYTNIGVASKNPDLIKKGEDYLRASLALAPLRQDVRHVLSNNLSLQGRYQEAIDLANKTIDLNKNIGDSYFHLAIVFLEMGEETYNQALENLEKAFSSLGFWQKNDDFLSNAYEKLFDYFYKKRDTKNFVVVATRLIQIEPEREELLKSIIVLALNGQWDKINLK